MATLPHAAKNDNLNTKHCHGCGRDLPATLQYFSPQKPNGLASQCKQCHAANAAKYRKENAEKVKAYDEMYNASDARKVVKARYRATHREQIKVEKDRWDKDHREEQRAYCAEYNATHHEERLRYGRQRRLEHREELNKRHRQYRSTEHGRMLHRAHENARRARKLATSGLYTAEDLRVQYRNQRGRCYYCKTKLGKTWHADHVVPLSRGGTNDKSNIVITCPPCNLKKNNKLLHEWEEGGRLL